MGNVLRIVVVVLTLLVLTAAPHAQQQPAGSGSALSLDAFIDRLTKAESALTTRMGTHHPIVEVYLQNLVAQDPKLGAAPVRDDYFLGQFEGKDRPDMAALSASRGW